MNLDQLGGSCYPTFSKAQEEVTDHLLLVQTFFTICPMLGHDENHTGKQ